MPRTPEEQALYQKQYRELNSESISEQRKKYRLQNKEKVFAQKKAYREKHKETITLKKKEYYEQNKEKILQKEKDKRIVNLEKYRKSARDKYHATKHLTVEKRREYSRKNQSKNNENKKKYNKTKRATDPRHLIMGRLRCRLTSALKGYGWSKNKSTGDMIGCSQNEFVKHIESLFTDGMGWQNREQWHLDHIIPLASAQNVEEMQNLNHFTNIQPMWAIDNLIKGSKHER